MRLLPPKVQLQDADSYAGMIPGNLPAIAPVGIDLTASYKSYFADTDTILFQRQNLEPGIGVMSGSNWITSSNQIITSSFYVSGNAVKGIADGLAFKRRQEISSFRPYFDFGNAAADGKGSNVEFYATGSSAGNIGEELYQPVWSKVKIEIDLTPNIDADVISTKNWPGLNGQSGLKTDMAGFWNNSSKRWQNLEAHNGWIVRPWSAFTESFTQGNAISGAFHMFDNLPIGFGGSASPVGVLNSFQSYLTGAMVMMGRPISNFGFPDHKKFELPTPNTIAMSKYISKPFLAEKIVLYCSASLSFDPGWSSQRNPQETAFSVWTFFILNQRDFQQENRAFSFRYYSGSISPPRGHVATTQSLGLAKARDLVTWMQVSTINGAFTTTVDFTPLKREFFISSSATNIHLGVVTASQQFVISGAVKTPVPFTGVSNYLAETFDGTAGDEGRTIQWIESWITTSRRINADISERSWNNPIIQPTIVSRMQESTHGWLSTGHTPRTSSVDVGNIYEYPSPYLLHPSDNLILGWQLPTPTGHPWSSGSVGTTDGVMLVDTNTTGQPGMSMTFSSKGINKLVIYGSFLEEGKESTEIQDTDPSCISVRRVIGE
jgi:hypothetical protein